MPILWQITNNPGYLMVPTLTWVLAVKFLLLLYFGCTTNQRSIPFGFLLHLLVQGHGPLLCFLEAVPWVGGKGSGDATTADVHTLLEAFLTVPEICQFHWWNFFSGIKQNFWSRDCSPQVLLYEIFQIILCQIIQILLYLFCICN